MEFNHSKKTDLSLPRVKMSLDFTIGKSQDTVKNNMLENNMPFLKLFFSKVK